jgi:phosphotransferase system HPr (HPr) family protein
LISAAPFTAKPPTHIVIDVKAVEATLEIKNRLGLHLRAASVLAQTAKQFDSAITLRIGGHEANARSVTQLIMLGAAQGAKVKVAIEGADAAAAASAIRNLFDNGFGED